MPFAGWGLTQVFDHRRLEGKDAAALPPALAFLDGHLPHPVLREAAARGARLGIAPEAALISGGAMSEAAYYRALADAAGISFLAPGWQAFDKPFLARALLKGRVPQDVVPLEGGEGGPTHATAPRGWQVKNLLAITDPAARARLTVVPPTFLRAELRSLLREASHARAAEYLKRFAPALSAATRITPPQAAVLGLMLVAVLALAAAAPGWLASGASGLLSLVFASHIGLKLASLFDPPAQTRQAALPEHALPDYAVLVPLYQEQRQVVGQLREALLALDYPAEKLSILLISEEDDAATAAAIESFPWPAHVQRIAAPPGQPRTKPKAMNIALPFVEAPFLTIFDAEDIPEPEQLRKAAARFATDAKLACLQARLSFFNAHTNWLTRQFAIEYATLFDRLLPAFERLKLPLPLGGTSNHFRVEALRAVGGWDPYNVTEDADLGVRLKALGHTTSMLDSETQEEATSKYLPWHRQRTRWQKGWLQTWLVHMREPARLYRTIGPRAFFGFQAYIGGLILAPFAHLAMVCGIVFALVTDSEAAKFTLSWQFFALIGGYVASFAIAFRAIWQRDQRLMSGLPWLPLYWLIISFASIHSVWQLIREPFYWAKTPHGFRLRELGRGQAENKAKPFSPLAR